MRSSKSRKVGKQDMNAFCELTRTHQYSSCEAWEAPWRLPEGGAGGEGGEAREALWRPGKLSEAPWRLPGGSLRGERGGRGGSWGESLEAWVRPGMLPGGSLRGKRRGEAPGRPISKAGGRLEAGWRQAVCTMAPARVDASTLSSYR